MSTPVSLHGNPRPLPHLKPAPSRGRGMRFLAKLPVFQDMRSSEASLQETVAHSAVCQQERFGEGSFVLRARMIASLEPEACQLHELP